MLLTSLPPLAFLACFLRTHTTLPKGDTAHNDLGPLTPISNQQSIKCLPHTYLQDNLGVTFTQFNLPLPK